MAVPKRKTSKAKRNSRRSANMKKTAPGLSICPQCHEPKLPHRVLIAITTMARKLLLQKSNRHENYTLRFPEGCFCFCYILVCGLIY